MPRTQKKDIKADIKRREQQNEALDLRKMGYSYRAIAEEMSISAAKAHKLVQDALREIPKENAAAVLDIQLARYDELLAANYANALRGDTAATKACLDILARIERLYGIHGASEEDRTAKVKSMLDLLLATSTTDPTDPTGE